jgi:hypothetical protein
MYQQQLREEDKPTVDMNRGYWPKRQSEHALQLLVDYNAHEEALKQV